MFLTDSIGLKRKAVAAQTPEVTVAGGGGFDANKELVGRMETAVRVAFSGMLVLGNRDAGAGGFAHVQWRSVPAINFYRRPFRQDWHRSRGKVLKFSSAIDNLAVHNRQHGFNPLNFLFGHGKIILREGDHVRELPDGYGAFLAAFTREPTAALSVEPQGFLPAQAVCTGIERSAPEGVAADEPIKRQPRIIAGHARGIGAGTDRDAEFEHLSHWRGPLGGLASVAIEEILALEGHAVLDGDASSQRFHALEAAIRDGFAMIEEPIGSLERDLTVDLFKDVQHPGDAFVVGSVETERPLVRSQQRDDLFQILLEVGRQVGPGFQEIFEICRRVNQHFSRAVAPIEIVALTRRRQFHATQEILFLLLWFLRENIVGHAHGHFSPLVQFFDDRIVVRVDLRAAARVHQAGEAKSVELAHEMAGRVHLLFRWQLGLLADGSVKNPGIGAGDEESGGVAVSVTLDFTRRRIGRVFGVAAGPQRGLVQHSAAIQVQDEDRRFGGDGVNLLEGRHATLGELELAPAANDSDPLAGRCPLCLLFEHAQGVCEGRNAVPSQLQIVAEAAADDVHVRIVQARNKAASFQVNDPGLGPARVGFRVVHADDATAFDGDIVCLRVFRIEGGDASVVENQIGLLGCVHINACC